MGLTPPSGLNNVKKNDNLVLENVPKLYLKLCLWLNYEFCHPLSFRLLVKFVLQRKTMADSEKTGKSGKYKPGE